ncbi:MAG: zf-HC2 domain-containing protein [Candidatus Thiodiazotropha sp. (ex. Lucinisca nassula)]|nr:zf-HC2 domain-containing protein [Candidatus Thiodiazotropha sp. (ex. Lucinisca nassula)]MBW9260344.1 zf-HC2 domain-containing protein [Candidatus Thiodiazotropha sp. (ex. Lucinisca nassula)]MBW9268127.1 zf-HC2 domain-containing protein [Candidatus Thiodiazotropha sp. (ex. Lucinisca nassula)]
MSRHDHSKKRNEIIDSDCLEAFDHVYAYINGEIDDEQTLAKIEHHLSHCKSCFSRAEMERKINQRLKAAKESSPPEVLENRLKHLIDDL